MSLAPKHPAPMRLALLALALISLPAAAQDVVLFEESFTVRDGGGLAVDLGAESVVLETGPDGRATVTVEGRGRDARREFERRRFSARAAGGGLTVQTDPPTMRGFGRTDAQFTVTVRLPRRFDVSADIGSGSLRGDALDGALTVDIGSGSVRLDDVRGPVSVETGSGSVRLGRVGGALRVETGSGSVAVEALRGAGTVSTGSGSVEVGLDRADALRVRTGSGSVRITLPGGADADVSISGSSVRIDDALGFDGRRERRAARGRIGRGGPRIDVSTGSGGVALLAR